MCFWESYKVLSQIKKFEIFKHELVPKHILLSREEAAEVLSRYKINAYQMPHIKSSDPVIKELGAKLGDIIKIIRNSPTTGEAVAYRYVVG